MEASHLHQCQWQWREGAIAIEFYTRLVVWKSATEKVVAETSSIGNVWLVTNIGGVSRLCVEFVY